MKKSRSSVKVEDEGCYLGTSGVCYMTMAQRGVALEGAVWEPELEDHKVLTGWEGLGLGGGEG